MPNNSGLFPALYLYPLNDSFVPKHIVLAGGQRVKIGRQTNAKTVPGEKNGYFDSKVLSRQHAEVWEEGGKIYIRDVKSSNGTFINGARLSQEGVESPPFVLNTDDQVEFGIDIVGEDNQTIIHHKVSARVQCILSQEDLNAAQSHAVYAQQAQHNLAHSQQGHLQQAPPGQRRPSLHGPQGHQGSLGALAPVGRMPNKNGLSFDLILNRLQSELQRSRETTTELHSLTSAMSEIHDSLGGVTTQPIPAYPHTLPPVRQESDPSAQQLPPPPPEIPAISNLQEQLHQTQSLLSTHVEKIHSLGLESILGEHDGIKREIGMLRDMIDQRKHEVDLEASAPHHNRPLDDDDDARSVSTVVAGERYPEDELDEENEEERRRRREELGRPRTPEPSMGLDGDSDGEGDLGMRGAGLRGPRGTIRRTWENGMPRGEAPHVAVENNSASKESVERLTDRLEQLAAQFESALELSRELQAKQVVAQEQIASLQAKVDELEASKETSQSNGSPATSEQPGTSPEFTPSIVSNLVELTKNLEGRWDRQREEWDQERDRLRAAKEEWERRVRRVEEDLSGVREVAATASTSATHAVNSVNAQAKELAALTSEVRDIHALEHNHDASEFAPPSPRSISSDILRKRKRTSNRPRSRSSSPSPTRASPNGHIIEEEAIQPYSPTSLNSAPYAANGQPLEGKNYHGDTRRLPTTMKNLDTISRSDSNSSSSLSSVTGRKPEIPIPYMSAAATLGVALLGVAAWTAANHIHA